MSIDEIITAAIGSIAGLAGKVYPYTAIKDAAAPFVFYIQTAAAENEELDGLSGLKSAEYELHVVASTNAGAQLLGDAVKTTMQTLALTDRGGVHFGRAVCDQRAPTMNETQVGLWRRPLFLHLDYTEAVS